MYDNIGSESPLISNSENSSVTPDILEQIKKKSEEISTSDASTKLLQNLSNPTNLTNPKIINSLNRNDKLPLIKKNKLTFSNDYIRNFPKKSKSELSIKSNKSQFSTIDPFDLDIYHKLVEKAELEILSNKNKEASRKKIILEKIDQNLISEKQLLKFNRNDKIKPPKKCFSQNQLIIPEEEEDIWEKVKNMKLSQGNKVKDKKTNFVKFIPKNEYIAKTNLIKFLKFNNNNKNERYHQYLSLSNSQMKSTDNTIKKLLKSKDFLEKKYNDQYILYLKFLKETLEKEKVVKIELMNEKNKRLFEVNKLQKYITKITNVKDNLIRWLYLQIQVKEKLPKIPEYYKYIIEDNISLDEVNKRGQGKYNISYNEYMRIKNYRGKNIYNNPNTLIKKIETFEDILLSKLNNNLDKIDNDKKFKEEFEDIKKMFNVRTNEDNEKLKNLIYDLKNVKKRNIELQNDLIKVKKEKNFVRRNKNKEIIKRLQLLFTHYSNDELDNVLKKNNKPTLYYLILSLYYIVTSHNFKQLENIKIKLDFYKPDEKLILEVLEYAENVLNLLISNKKYYYSNPKLKQRYIETKDEIDKSSKIEKMIIHMKMQKQQEDEKKKKLMEKINKQYIKPRRKIDYEYYKKEMCKKNGTIMMQKSIKKETRFEDFLHDIYS